MDKRVPIDLELSGTASATGTCTLETKGFVGGGLLCLQRVAIRGTVNQGFTADVSFERAGKRLYIETLVTTATGEIEAMQGPVFAPGDYEVIVEFTGATASEVVYAWIYGYWVPPAE